MAESIHAAFPLLQDYLGIELMLLVEDPQAATIEAIVLEAHTQLAAQPHALPRPGSTTRDIGKFTSIQASEAVNVHVATFDESHIDESLRPLWVSPAPFSIKMRVFCLPYAGGVSENVFGRLVWQNIGLLYQTTPYVLCIGLCHC